MCAVYRAPNSDLSFLLTLYDKLLSLNFKNVIMTGDFNLPGIEWSKIVYGQCDRGDAVLDMMLALNLEQVVCEYARANAVFDLMFIGQHFSSGIPRIELGISDHSLLSFCWNVNSANDATDKRVVFVKDYARCSDSDIIEYLSATLDGRTNITSVENMWNSLKASVRYCIEHFIPNRAVRTRRKNPWVTREVMHLKRKLKRLRKHRHTSPQQWNDLKKALSENVTAAKMHYHNVTLPDFIKSDPQKFWRHLCKPTDKIEEIMLHGDSITEPHRLADCFNYFFYSVFTIDSVCSESKCVIDEAKVPVITADGVLSMLLHLSDKKSPGPDGLPNDFQKRFSGQLCVFLAKIFQVSLNSGEVPSDWNKARVVPIHKKGDKLLVTNYRLVSITSSCCKFWSILLQEKLEHVLA